MFKSKQDLWLGYTSTDSKWGSIRKLYEHIADTLPCDHEEEFRWHASKNVCSECGMPREEALKQ